MKIAVCDNEEYFVSNIIERVNQYGIKENETNKIDGYTNPDRLLDGFRVINYDLVFLDIEMENMNGISVAKMIRELNAKCIIIFVSGYLKYIHDTYRVGAFQFITKPIDDDLFNEELNRAVKQYRSMNRTIQFCTDDGKKYIKTKDIVFIETAYRKYRICPVVPTKSIYGNSNSIQTIKKNLVKYNFYLINRSIIVNLDYIERIGQESVTMLSGDTFTVSRKYWKNLKIIYFKHIDRGDV